MTDTKNTSNGESTKSHDQTAEDRVIGAGEETMHEMKDAMTTMMEAGSQMMQACIDMQLSYLKVMRAGVENPQATMDIMTKNARDIAGAMKNSHRKE